MSHTLTTIGPNQVINCKKGKSQGKHSDGLNKQRQHIHQFMYTAVQINNYPNTNTKHLLCWQSSNSSSAHIDHVPMAMTQFLCYLIAHTSTRLHHIVNVYCTHLPVMTIMSG